MIHVSPIHVLTEAVVKGMVMLITVIVLTGTVVKTVKQVSMSMHSKHEIVSQCFNVGPASETVGQH